jgi:hypothetical protein
MNTPPKRFLVFACADYYPSGGWDDLYDSFETKEDAVLAAKNCVARDRYLNCHVIDLMTGSEPTYERRQRETALPAEPAAVLP